MGQRKTTIQTGAWAPSWGYGLEASASMAQYPTNQSRSTGTNYWVTGSMIIPAGVATITSASYGLGPVNTTAKVSIPFENFVSKNTLIVHDSDNVKGFSILAYNGVISTLAGYNEFSSSTFNNTSQSYAVIYVSASKANMGNIGGNSLYLSLGTTQMNSATRNGNDSTTNVSEHVAFATKYPTDTRGWSLVKGVLTSPKNQ